MILEQFFAYYLDRVDPGVKEQLLAVMPPAEPRTPDALAKMFKRNDDEALDFLLRFHNVLNVIRENDPYNCIIFNVAENVCFPFFIEYVLDRIPAAAKSDIEAMLDSRGVDAIVDTLRRDKNARNQFRKAISSLLTQDDLFTLNEVIALQNFSSGGEYSFLSLAYPDIADLSGRVLDAGCGAGFASLVMSQKLDVVGLDACLPRVNRAQGLASLLRNGNIQFFSRLLQLIEDEMGTLACEVHFPKANELITDEAGNVAFQQGSLDSLPFYDEEFDVIFCMDVLEHTYSPEAVIRQFGRVAKHGAIVYITGPNLAGEIHQKFAENEEGSVFPALLHMHHFDPEGLTAMFGQCGFSPVKIELFDTLPREEFAMMVSEDNAEGQAILARGESEIPRQIFAVFRKE